MSANKLIKFKRYGISPYDKICNITFDQIVQQIDKSTIERLSKSGKDGNIIKKVLENAIVISKREERDFNLVINELLDDSNFITSLL